MIASGCCDRLCHICHTLPCLVIRNGLLKLQPVFTVLKALCAQSPFEGFQIAKAHRIQPIDTGLPERVEQGCFRGHQSPDSLSASVTAEGARGTVLISTRRFWARDSASTLGDRKSVV